ncbi:hypothetical protein Sjap_011588 [Stephania japonica]|uniref:Uncharacterized protein n=1 Tax=Stephania japonica TaxID=461633 RepID=A0AAP0JDG6_9MAGN
MESRPICEPRAYKTFVKLCIPVVERVFVDSLPVIGVLLCCAQATTKESEKFCDATAFGAGVVLPYTLNSATKVESPRCGTVHKVANLSLESLEMRELQHASASKNFDEVSMERSNSFIKASCFEVQENDGSKHVLHDECLDPQDLEAMWGDPEVSKQRIGVGEDRGQKFHLSHDPDGQPYLTQTEMKVK